MLLEICIFNLFLIQVNSQTQTICGNPSTNCFDPTTTQSLLFQQNQMTSCARTAPINQLNCIEGSAGLCAKYSNQITSIKCSNSGTDDSNNVIWKCESDLPNGLIFGLTQVSCEGCKSSADELKITGSCGIFYQLVNTMNNNNNNNIDSNSGSGSGSNSKFFDSDGIKTLKTILIAGFIISFCVFCVVSAHKHDSHIISYSETTPLNSNIHNIFVAQPIQSFQPVSSESIPTAPVLSTFPEYLMSNHSYSRPSRYQEPSNFLTGYIVGRELEEGNVGDAMLISSMSGNRYGNNYNTGIMMGRY